MKKSSEYERNEGLVEAEDYLDCVAEARRAAGLSDVVGAVNVGDVGGYLGCVDEARAIIEDVRGDDGQEDDVQGQDGVSPGDDSPGITLLRFCVRHGLESDGWSRQEE